MPGQFGQPGIPGLRIHFERQPGANAQAGPGLKAVFSGRKSPQTRQDLVENPRFVLVVPLSPGQHGLPDLERGLRSAWARPGSMSQRLAQPDFRPGAAFVAQRHPVPLAGFADNGEFRPVAIDNRTSAGRFALLVNGPDHDQLPASPRAHLGSRVNEGG